MIRTTVLTAGILSIALAAGAILTPAAYALTSVITDPRGDATNKDPNFDIRRAGITDTGKLRLVVDGEAGATKPSHPGQANKVFAYVFVTDKGIVAVTSHRAEDSAQVNNDLTWHSHKVTLDSSNCVTSIEDFGRARLADDHIHVANTDAKSIERVLTAELTIDSGKVCVSQVWDSAT